MSSRFRPVIRVFVSSTFSDLKEERNVLQRDVFPRLEHYCLVRGFQFQAIDLRWGVPGEAVRDHRTMQICFDELRRAQEISPRPNFLVLLGDRYGWQPLAETITEAEFQTLETKAGELDLMAGRGLQAGDSATQALRTWYRRDDNAVPVEYQLRSRNDWPGPPEWADEDEQQAWKQVEQTLWAVINGAFPQEGLAGRFRQIPGADEPLPSIVKFQASATEQEIWRGALAVPDAPDHVVAWYRTIRNREQYQHDPRANDFFDREEALLAPAAALKEELKKRLRRNVKRDIPPVEVELKESADGKKLEVTHDHLQPMCDEIETRLREIIDQEIRAYWSSPGASGSAAPPDQSGPSEARKLELETQAHRLFGEGRAPKDGFVGRDQELKAIADYLSDEYDRNPLVVHGPSGTGKTALLAREAQIATNGHMGRIFLRFLGTTPQSSNLNTLLTSLCRELRPSEDRANDLPIELRLLQDEFDRLLALATAEKPILLFLDALDQLDEADGARQAYWLRTPLPEHVKVVISCIRDEEGPTELNESYRSFDRRKLLERAVAVESLTAPDAMRAIDLWLQNDRRRPDCRRKLTIEQRDAIASRVNPDLATDCRRPLYLRILFEECRLWPSWRKVEPADLGENTAELLNGLFDRLVQPAVHGPLLVESALSYIASARRGLSENEILEVLWADQDFKRHLDDVSRKTKHELPSGATRIPIAIWSRLRHDLDPYLTKHSSPGGVVLNFYHRVVGRVVEERFLKEAAQRRLRHSRLAGYFQSEQQPWWRPTDGTIKTRDGAPRAHLPNTRRTSELPWALLREADEADPNHEKPDVWDAPVNLLCDLAFVEVKCAADLVFELQEDYRNTIAGMPEAQEGLRQERLRQERLVRWTDEITTYSRQWSERRERLARGEVVSESVPRLSEPPPTCRMWTEEEIEANCKHIVENPARQDRVRAFAGFVEQQFQSLAEFGAQPGFVIQHAFNYAPCGPVHDSADLAVPVVEAPLLTRHWSVRDQYNPNPALKRTLEDCVSPNYIASVTPDGRRAVSTNDEHALQVWNVETGMCLRVLQGQTFPVNSVSMTPNGRFAVSASFDKTLRVWDLETGMCLRVLEGHTASVENVSVTPDGSRAVSISDDNTLRVWDLKNGICLATLEGLSGRVCCVRVSLDGRLAVSTTWGDNTLWLWDLEAGRCLRVLEGHTDSVNGVSVMPDGKRAVSASADHTWRMWDLETGMCLRVLEGHTDSVEDVSVTPNGRRAVSVSSDHTLRVWDLDAGNCVRVLGGHTGGVIGVSVTLDGQRAVTTSFDHTLRLWDLETGMYQRALDSHSSEISCLSVTPNGRRAVSGSLDHTLRVWNLETGMCLRVLEGHMHQVLSVSATPDGQRAVSASWDHTLRVWNLETGICMRVLSGHTERVNSVGVTPDRQCAVSASDDANLRIWELKTGMCLKVLVGHSSALTCVCVTPDGLRAVSASYDATLRVWDLKRRICLKVLVGHTDGVISVTLTPDGRRAVSASWDKTLRVWDLETGRCLRVLEGHNNTVESISVTSNGRRVVSASWDRALRVWDLETGNCLHVLEGHKRAINCVCVTPDGRNAISASDDKTMRIWELDGGNCVAIASLAAPVTKVLTLPTLNRVIVGTWSGEMFELDLHGMTLVPAAPIR